MVQALSIYTNLKEFDKQHVQHPQSHKVRHYSYFTDISVEPQSWSVNVDKYTGAVTEYRIVVCPTQSICSSFYLLFQFSF